MTPKHRAADGMRVEVAADPGDRQIAVQAAAAFARVRGAAPLQVDRTCEVVEAVLAWAAARAYPEGSGTLTLDLTAGDNGVLVTVIDEGRPAEEFGGYRGREPDSLAPVAGVTRGLRQVNLGTAGNLISAVVDLPGFRPNVPRNSPPRDSRHPGSQRERLLLRDAAVDDAPQIANLIYECYGHDYAHEGFYRPEWIAEQIAAGRLLAVVAVLAGEVVGHNALMVEDPDAAVEIGALAVATAHRGLGITGDLAEAVAARARSCAAPAVLVRPVTHHSRTQRAAAQWGFTTTALLLGAAPYGEHPRSALLVEYLALRTAPRAVSLPSRYQEEVTATYDRLRLARIPAEVTRTPARVERRDDQVGDLPGTARLIVSGWDGDSSAALVDAVRTARQSGAAVVYCDVDLHTADGRQLDEIVAMLRSHDFFYCGLLPFGSGGHDHLRLQAMLTDQVQVDAMVLHSPDSRHLLDVILADAGPRLPRA